MKKISNNVTVRQIRESSKEELIELCLELNNRNKMLCSTIRDISYLCAYPYRGRLGKIKWEI